MKKYVHFWKYFTIHLTEHFLLNVVGTKVQIHVGTVFLILCVFTLQKTSCLSQFTWSKMQINFNFYKYQKIIVYCGLISPERKVLIGQT